MAVTNSKKKQFKNISKQLAAAAAGLTATHTAQAEDLYNDWEVDVGYLRYEEDSRITVDTYMAKINGNLSEKDTIGLGVVFDTLTGVTPTGALPDDDIVAVSGVSGGGYSTSGSGAGFVPFDDTRLAIDTTWGHEWARTIRSNLSAYVSVEGDYTAVGGGIGMEFDTEDRAWTFTTAFGIAGEKVGTTGEDTPAPLTEVDDNIRYNTGNKNVYDALFGVSRIINKRTVAMLNYSYGLSLGYHTDPYKTISIADIDDNVVTDIFERRPDERERHIIYTKMVHETRDGNHVDISYRYHTDNWNVNSHTLEYGFSFTDVGSHTFKPYIRLYHQEAANFHTRSIAYDGFSTFDSIEIPEYASADVRLSEMLTTSLGLKYRYKTSRTGSVDVRVGYYHQQFTDAILDEYGTVFVNFDFSKAFKD